jgi:hypothetical protein
MAIERQHFVSQGFLRGFSIPGGKTNKFIWHYRKDPKWKPKRSPVKSVAWESFYYEQETEAGARDTDTLEVALAKSVDHVAPRIIRSLDAKPGSVVALSAEDRGVLGFFLGFSLTRVPSFRAPIRELYTWMAQRLLDSAAEQDPKLKELVDAHGVTAEAKRWVSLKPMVEMAQLIAKSALLKNWQFFVPPEGVFLLTSDNPVIFSVAKSYGLDRPGPAHPAAELVANLRKDLALVCTPKDGGPQHAVFQMTREEAHKFNRGVVRAAHLAVFAPVQSAGIDQLVKAHIGQEQTIELH